MLKWNGQRNRIAMETRKRQQILDDTGFWIRLEGAMTEWLRASPDPLHRRYWIDGFVCESMINTQYGADVIGRSGWRMDAIKSCLISS